MEEIELEKTYLAKQIPKELITNAKLFNMIDYYIDSSDNHPHIRLRKKNDKYYFTRKVPINKNDHSKMSEKTIELDNIEFEILTKNLQDKVIKKRYLTVYNNIQCEIDIFEENLSGLVLIDFEFKTEKEKEEFKMPNFCLVDVTQEEFIAGGMLSKSNYEDIENNLNKLSYKKLNF